MPGHGEYFSAGIHPLHIPPHPEEALEELDRLAASPFCIAIGEAGLDKRIPTPLSIQREIFLCQAKKAASCHLPLVVHCVRAWGELLSARKDIPTSVVCVVHGFRGNPRLAEILLDKGFYLSFGFRFNPQSLMLCPPVRLFLESDEDPRPIVTLYHAVSDLRSCPPEKLRARCWENLARILPSLRKAEI